MKRTFLKDSFIGFDERDFQRVIDTIHEVDLEIFLYLGRKLGNILFVIDRDDDFLDPRTQRGQGFLAKTPDGKRFSAEGDLARHRDARLDLSAREAGDDGRRHGNASARTVFRDGPFGYVDVDIVLRENLGVDSITLGIRADIVHGDCRAFLHHVAQLTGEDKPAFPGEIGHFNRQDVAAELGISESRNDADLIFLLLFASFEELHAKIFVNLIDTVCRQQEAMRRSNWRTPASIE